MDNNKINKNLQDRFYAHQSTVDTDALWTVVNPKRQKKKRFVVFWWFVGVIGVLILSFFFFDNNEVDFNDQKIIKVEKLLAESEDKVNATGKAIVSSESSSFENSKSKDYKKNIQSNFNQNSTEHQTQQSEPLLKEQSIQTANHSDKLITFYNDFNQDFTPNDMKTSKEVDTNRIDEERSESNDILQSIASLPHQFISPFDLLRFSMDHDLIKPLKEQKAKSKFSLNGYFGMGSFDKNIKNSTIQERNLNNTESPYLFMNVGLFLKRKVSDSWYVMGGLDFRQYQDRFQYQYSEIRSEEVEVVTEEIITQTGIQEVVDLATIDVKYDYTKDLINKTSRISGFIGLGYEYAVMQKLLLFADCSFHYSFAKKYSGQVLWMDQGVKNYKDLSKDFNQSGIMAVCNRLGITYYFKPNTSIGVYGNLLYDLSSSVIPFEQRNTAWSIGLTTGYQF